MQIEVQVLTAQVERYAPVVKYRASVAQFQAANPQAEECFSPVAIARGASRGGNVAFAIFVDPDEYLRALDNQFIQSDLSPEEREDVQAHFDPVCVKQRWRIGGFQSVNRQPLDIGSEPPNLQVECIHFDAGACSILNLLHKDAANPLLREVCPEKNSHSRANRDQNEKRSADPEFGASAQGLAPVAITST